MTQNGLTVYRARSGYDFGITKMIVERTTGSYVWIEGRRVAREASDTRVFDDFDSAKEWLARVVTDKHEVAERSAQKLAAQLADAMAIIESEVETKTTRW